MRTVQATFLLAPLVVLLTLSLILSAVQWAAQFGAIGKRSGAGVQGKNEDAGREWVRETAH